MDAFEASRIAAAKLHDEALAGGSNSLSPPTLIARAIGDLDLVVEFADPADPVLKGARALYDAQSGTIVCDSSAAESDRLLLIAHELGHVSVDGDSSTCRSSDVDVSRPTEEAAVGIERVEDYGVRERRELCANVFAREFLLPRAAARRLFVEENLSASDIASRVRLPKDLVRQQLLDALLLPPVPPQSARAAAPIVPDPAQEVAVSHRGGAFQLQAGPGTGKTRTLVLRVMSLLAEGVDPASILVLTFSNRAAGELSERIGAAAKVAVGRMWIGTFHAFGLELIRRHHDKLGLPEDPSLFDRGDAIGVLEDILPTLPLVHYRNLWDPAFELRPIVNAISRAKDELVEARGYQQLASDMRVQAANDEERERAEKALEVAEVYRHYEVALQQRGAVDFGDLIMRPALLLEGSASLTAAVQLRHRHVLVDEYQDVNRASARFLKVVVGDGKRLWVVGDSRQSIYRFRGASSHNMNAFAHDFSGARAERLTKNYRSFQEIVTTFQSFAAEMSASKGMLPLALDAQRGASGRRPEIRGCDDPDSELRSVAASVRELEREGVPLRSQAVLCRGNSRLGQFASALEQHGIPVLHLGSLFEREEIRDLLCILSLVADAWGSSLVRVGAMDRYEIPLQDVHRTVRQARSSDTRALELLSNLDAIPDLSEPARRGLALLSRDLDGIGVRATPWEALTTYLLDRSDLVRRIAGSTTIQDRMRGIAIWQLTNFARSGPSGGPIPPIAQLLERVRRLVLLAEERDLRQVPEAALHMDAVRMMTVHGSKGLEFEAVHIPGLTMASFPANNQGDRCPPPDKMVSGTEGVSGLEGSRQAHDDEEECLFFVAMSRARSNLHIYVSRKQAGGKNRTPSPFLDRIRQNIQINDAPPTLLPLPVSRDQWNVDVTWPANRIITQADVTAYDRCRRRFFYTEALGLGGLPRLTPFTKTHACLYDLFDWLAKQRLSGPPSLAAAEAEFERIWLNSGPSDHAFASEYRKLASTVIKTLIDAGVGRRFRPPEKFTVGLPSGQLVIEPDEMAELPDKTVVVRRVRTGKQRRQEADDIVYALYQLAVDGRVPQHIVEGLFLTDGTTERFSLSAKKIGNSRNKATEIVRAIRAGEFPPDPSQMCPRCPHFFICAAAARGPLALG